MTTLLEIAPATQSVKLLDREATLRGFSLRKLAVLLTKFPEMSSLILKGGSAVMDIGKLVSESPDACMALIQTAAPADAWVGAVFDDLPLKDQITLLSAVLKLTLPEAVTSPFVMAVHSLAAAGHELAAPTEMSSQSSQPASSS